jgi:hypothetical protein
MIPVFKPAAFKPLASLALACTVLAAASPAGAQQTKLGGACTGGSVGQDGADPSLFDVTLLTIGSELSGTIVEVNTIGEAEEAPFLTATRSGSVNNGAVSGVKTYDGSGGVRHSVTDTGTLDATGRHIRRIYSASGAAGQFDMVR